MIRAQVSLFVGQVNDTGSGEPLVYLIFLAMN